MDPRFPPPLTQSQIDSRDTAWTQPLPSAPSLHWGEWLIAVVGLILLSGL